MKNIDTLNQSMKRWVNLILTNRYKVQITSVGNRDEKEIHNFIDNAFGDDSGT